MNIRRLIKYISRRSIAAFALTVSFNTVYAQDSFASLDEAKTSFAKVLDEFVSHDQSEALRKLPRITTSRSDEEQRLAIQRFIQFNLQTSEKRGPASTYKYISTVTISDVISRVRFVVLAERLPLTMDFFLYKPVEQSNWKLCDVSFATGPKILFSSEDQLQNHLQVAK